VFILCAETQSTFIMLTLQAYVMEVTEEAAGITEEQETIDG